eukprot:TRINITY_DN1508_c0_g1_i2.p1 TRINITY_DN1508_c0_g1~~TRINITY_DN1508_c0_g1_i2.p1  ORF type:complete len:1085 (+),score=304.16 TRINITY_DN1508_c0_g1_i2:74-3256(+)
MGDADVEGQGVSVTAVDGFRFYHRRRKSRSAAPGAGVHDEKETLEQIYNRTWDKDESEYMKSPADGKRLFRIRVSNVRAQDLLAKDIGGTSDPYLVFKWDGLKEFKTPVIQKTLNPIWRDFVEEFEFEVDGSANLSSKSVVMKCFDKDMISSDIIGEATVDLYTIATGPSQFEIKLVDDSKKFAGLVKLTIQMAEVSFAVLKVDEVRVVGLGAGSTSLKVSYQHKGSVRSTAVTSSAATGSVRSYKNLENLKIKAFLEDLIDQDIVFSLVDKGTEVLTYPVNVKRICPLDEQGPVSFKGVVDGKTIMGTVEWTQFPNTSQMRRGVMNSERGILKGVVLFRGVQMPNIKFAAPPVVPSHETVDDEEVKDDRSVSPQPRAVSPPPRAASPERMQDPSIPAVDIVSSGYIVPVVAVSASGAGLNSGSVPAYSASPSVPDFAADSGSPEHSSFVPPPDVPSYMQEDLPDYAKNNNPVEQSRDDQPAYMDSPVHDEKDEGEDGSLAYPILPDYLASPLELPPPAVAAPIAKPAVTASRPTPSAVPAAAPVVVPASAPEPTPAVVEDKLPEGYEKKVDAKGRTFYIDHFLKQTSWEAPKSLPQGWERGLDPKKNRVFYIDHSTKKTQWDPPSESQLAAPAAVAAAAVSPIASPRNARQADPSPPRPAAVPAPATPAAVSNPDALPEGYEKKIDPKSGRTVYVDHWAKTTAWTPPKPLPEGWERKLDPRTKRVFYVDNVNKKTSWDLPTEAAVASGAAVVGAVAASAPVATAPAATPSAASRSSGNSDVDKIPEGYEMQVDAKGRTYYVDHFLKTTSWEKPQALPSGWERAYDARKNKVYYIDHINKKTQWTIPASAAPAVAAVAPVASVAKSAPAVSVAPSAVVVAALPGGWDKATAKDGRTYYVDHFTKTTSWTAPAALPSGWERRYDSVSQRVYYANASTKTTQWDPPVAPVAAAFPVAAPIVSSSIAASSIQSAGYGSNRAAAAAPAAVRPVARQMKIPDGIEQKVDVKSGRAYYVDHFLKTTSWEAPKEIPSDWERAFDSRTGRVYYVDHTNKKTQFEHPCP